MPTSREGLRYNEYRLAAAITAFPLGCALAAPLLAFRPWVAEHFAFDPARIPSNALLYMMHADVPLMLYTPSYWALLERGGGYLGYHGFLSYLSTAYPFIRRTPVCRYTRGREKAPFEQTVEYLNSHRQGCFALRTDAGRPYGIVRASLVDLALRSERPLVGVRQRSDREILIGGHRFPRPRCTVTTYATEAVHPQTLRSLSREKARALLQEKIDGLARL